MSKIYPACHPSASVLTRAQIEVLEMLFQGKTHKEIAREKSRSERTISTHIQNMLDKMEVKNAHALVYKSLEHGILTPPPLAYKKEWNF